jgi:hypothetical protein
MDRERLTRLLEEPARMAREDLDDLKALTEKFPWFSGAHLLRAVGDHAFGDVLADGSLQQSAAHIPSRSVLFDLKDISLSEAAQQLQEHPVKIPAPSIEKFTRPEPGTLKEEPPIEVAPEVAETQESVEAELPLADPEKEELERQILEAALASAYDLTWQEKIGKPVVQEQEQVQEQVQEQEQEQGQVQGQMQEDELVQVAGTAPVEEVGTSRSERLAQVITARTKLKFSDWLSIEEDAAVKTSGSSSESVEKPSFIELPISSPPTPVKPALDPKDLIDRFIQSETPPPSRKAEFFTPQSAAKKSLDDSAGLVSETLARIYEKQGNFQKAIDAYRKLALKYPEKSAYFAALSKELEGKLNS